MLRSDFNLLKKIPYFEFTLEIEEVDLAKFDPFLEAYANFNLSNGILNIYSEAAALNSSMTGYVKPVIEELEILPVEKEEGAGQKAYEVVLAVTAEILENSDTGNIGTRVDFEGRIDDPDADVWEALWILLRNAFLERITKGVDHSIDFDQL